MRNGEAAHDGTGLRRLAWVVLGVSFLALLMLARPAEARAEVICPSNTGYLLPPGKAHCRPVCETPSFHLTAEKAGPGDGTFVASAVNKYDPAPYDYKGNPECAVPAGPDEWDVKKFCAQNAEFHCLHWHTYLAPSVGSPVPATAVVTATATSGSSFIGWSPNCVPSRRLAVPRTDCSVLMNANKTVTATFEPTPDTVAPAAPTLTAQVLTVNKVKVSWTGASDDRWLGGFEIYRDGALYAAFPRAPGSASGSLTFGSQLCTLTYEWQIRAFDSVHETASNTVSVFMGNQCAALKPPNTILHVAPPRRTRSRTAYFHWGSNRSHVRYQCKLDKRSWKKCFPGKTYRRLRVGKHVFRCRAYDAAGKDKTPIVYRWTVRKRR